MAIGIFTSTDCGNESGIAHSETGLQTGQQVQINGNTDLSSCIRGSDDAAVYSIFLQPDSGFYDYIISVTAQGPSGVFSGGMSLHFTDQSGDTYNLWIYSSRKQMHTVAYHSDNPSIVKIHWD